MHNMGQYQPFFTGPTELSSSAESDKNHVSRIAVILSWSIRKHTKDSGLDWNGAINSYARRTNIQPSRFREIVGGQSPLLPEIDKLCRGLNWSLFFLFGLRKETVEQKARQYYTTLGEPNPTPDDLKRFYELYKRLLRYVHPRDEDDRDREVTNE